MRFKPLGRGGLKQQWIDEQIFARRSLGLVSHEARPDGQRQGAQERLEPPVTEHARIETGTIHTSGFTPAHTEHGGEP